MAWLPFQKLTRSYIWLYFVLETKEWLILMLILTLFLFVYLSLPFSPMFILCLYLHSFFISSIFYKSQFFRLFLSLCLSVIASVSVLTKTLTKFKKYIFIGPLLNWLSCLVCLVKAPKLVYHKWSSFRDSPKNQIYLSCSS